MKLINEDTWGVLHVSMQTAGVTVGFLPQHERAPPPPLWLVMGRVMMMFWSSCCRDTPPTSLENPRLQGGEQNILHRHKCIIDRSEDAFTDWHTIKSPFQTKVPAPYMFNQWLLLTLTGTTSPGKCTHTLIVSCSLTQLFFGMSLSDNNKHNNEKCPNFLFLIHSASPVFLAAIHSSPMMNSPLT